MRTLALASFFVALAVSAAAAARLDTVGSGTVRETGFTYQVRLDGVIATVTARQELTGDGDADAEAVYSFSLPSGAAIVGLAVTPPGGTAQRGAAVDADAAITAAADRDTVAMAADLGLVRRLGAADEGGDVAYELRAFPIRDGATTVVEITWVQPMTYVDGRLVLRVPGRGFDFAAATGTVTVKPPPGVAKVRDLHAGGDLLAAKPGKQAWPFVAILGDLSIDVTPVLGDSPVVSFATAKVVGDTGALAVTVLRPRADDATSRFARAIFVIDVSGSNAGDEARAATAALVDGVAADLRADAMIQAVLFDRWISVAMPAFAEVSAEARASIGDAITAAPGLAGTDLVLALGEVRARLDAEPIDGATLVVVVTDGVLPSDASADELGAALDAGGETTVSVILVGPDALPPPDPRGGVLAELVSRYGGHVIGVRHAEASARAATIAGEVSAAADWYLEGVTSGTTAITLALPDTIGAGGGAIGFGWYRGDAPTELDVVTSDRTLTARKAKAGALPRIAALARATGWTPLLEEEVEEERDGRALAAIERKLGMVGPFTALVAVDRDDELAAARLDLAARGGTFARIPPPPESEVEVPEAAIAEVTEVGTRYEMDTAGRIRADLLQPQLLPAAHRCFDAALLRGAAPRGTVTLEIELARGEVIAARTRSTGATELLGCLRDAAYALSVPSYTLTDDPDTIYLIRYPIVFAAKGTVAVGDDDGLDPIDLGDAVDSPLGDLVPDPEE